MNAPSSLNTFPHKSETLIRPNINVLSESQNQTNSGRKPQSTFSIWSVQTGFMKTMARWSVVGLVPWLLLACSFFNLQDHRIDSRTLVQNAVDSVRASLEKDLQNQVPSLNVFIQTPTEKIFVSSVPSGNTPITETTFFRFASNTKNFTATAILNMYEDGWLDYKAHTPTSFRVRQSLMCRIRRTGIFLTKA